MGLTFVANNRKAKGNCRSPYDKTPKGYKPDWDMNSAGSSLLGYIGQPCGFIMERDYNEEWCKKLSPQELEEQKQRDAETDRVFPRHPYVPNAIKCKAAAVAIRAYGPETLDSLFKDIKDLWGGTKDEFLQYVLDYATFLDTCDGYHAE
jgi:hypothetical protein